MHDAGVVAGLVGPEAVLLLEHHDLRVGPTPADLPRDGEAEDAGAHDADGLLAHRSTLPTRPREAMTRKANCIMDPMPRRPPRHLLLRCVAAGLLLLTAACGTVPVRHVSSVPTVNWKVVALGDSVTSGGRCDCTPFPQVYGSTLSAFRGVSATVDNLGQGGQNSTGLLSQLRDPTSKQSVAVRSADIDLVTIGANDFSAQHDDITTGRCNGALGTDCVRDEVDQLRSNVSAIVNVIHHLRAGRPTAILVTGYWNVFEDGEVARSSFPDDGVAASVALTREANAQIRKGATAAGATYVDLYAPFHGPASDDGETTNLLGDDGDHPNARGHVLIARRLVAAGLPGLVTG